MRLQILKGFRDLKRKKIRSIPIIIVIILGGMVVGMYADFYIAWAEVERTSWVDHRYHHLLLTVNPMAEANLTKLVNQAKENTGLNPYFEIRTFIEADVVELNGLTNPSVTAYLYAVNSSRELEVDKLYYHRGTPLFDSTTPNVAVTDKTTAELNDWELGEILSVSTSRGSFNLTNIGLVDSPEYMLEPSLISEFYRTWDGPVIWMRYNDFLNNINSQFQANQIALYFNNPEQEQNRFLEELLSVIDIDNVIKIEGRHGYLATFTPFTAAISLTMIVAFGLIVTTMIFIVLKRSIEEEIATFGLFKALGFTNKEVMVSALAYGAIVSLIGGVIGAIGGIFVGVFFITNFFTLIGIKVLPTVQIGAQLLFIPPIGYIFITVILAIVGAVLACRRIFKLSPMESIRPTAKIKPGSKVLVERLAIRLRLQLSPLTIFSLRSLFQNKRKSLFIVIGIILASTLTLFGSMFVTSYNTGIDKQFNYYWNWDAQVIFSSYQNNTQLSSIFTDYDLNYEPILLVPLRFANDRSQIHILTGLFANTTMRRFDSDITPEDGKIIISQDLAQKINLAKNDEVEVYDLFGSKQSLTIEHLYYEISGSVILTTIDTARMLAHIENTNLANGVFIRTSNVEKLKTGLENNSLVKEITIKKELEDAIHEMDSAMLALIGAGMALGLIIGLAITVTVVSISISERKYDFVNLRALGVSNKEIFLMILLELVITGIIGIILGFLFGTWLTSWMFRWTADFGFVIVFEPTLINILLTIGNVLAGVVLATYISLRSLFRTSIAESTVSRIIG
ncbi:MAG: ABC transporter permease, partial [Promethearchaeota archaeon]